MFLYKKLTRDNIPINKDKTFIVNRNRLLQIFQIGI